MEGNNYQEIFNIQKENFNKVLKTQRLYSRKEKLIKIKKWIQKNKEKISVAIYKDLKKPKQEIYFSEINPIIKEIDFALKNIRNWCKPQAVETPLTLLGTKSKIIKEAKGVTLIISPWNFPFMLAISPLVSSIAAGNTAVIKPSEITTNTESLIYDMIKDIFDSKDVAVVKGGEKQTQKLLELPWSHIFFTGSPNVGKKIMQKASINLTPITLELGGRNIAIILKNTNLRSTAKKIIWGKFFNNGQSCLSPNCVLIESSIKNKFIKELKYEFVEMFGNYPKEIKNNKLLSRIVNEKHFDRISKLIDKSLENGARLIFGNNRDKLDKYISPTVLEIDSTNYPVFEEEIFGPVLPILEYKNIEEAISITNKAKDPLAIYIFSTSKKNQNKIIKQTTAGTTVINDTTIQFSNPNLPFGGVGLSGIGKTHGYYGFLEFTNQRSLLKQRNKLTITQIIYPKYNKFKNIIIKHIT